MRMNDAEWKKAKRAAKAEGRSVASLLRRLVELAAAKTGAQ